MKASQWIDRINAAKGWTDYRVAKELGFKSSTISMYRAHGTPMDEAIAMKVAHVLDVSPAIVLADQAMERAKNDEARSAWGSILERLGGVAAVVLLGVGLGTAPTPAQAKSGEQSVYYVKL